MMHGWLLILLAWFLGHHSRDLTTRDQPPPTPPTPPRPPRPVTPVSPPVSPPPVVPANVPPTSAPPWPQAVPAGLPAWPGGWEPDDPVGAGVAARAWELLPELWRYGQGTRKTEQTSGRWVTYVAKAMGSKRGVVAYRPRAGAMATPPDGGGGATPVSTQMPGSRTLRQGDRGPDVAYLQGRIGMPDQDGVFGGRTRDAVIAWQRTHRDSNGRQLAADGIVGPATWSSFGGGGGTVSV